MQNLIGKEFCSADWALGDLTATLDCILESHYCEVQDTEQFYGTLLEM